MKGKDYLLSFILLSLVFSGGFCFLDDDDSLLGGFLEEIGKTIERGDELFGWGFLASFAPGSTLGSIPARNWDSRNYYGGRNFFYPYLFHDPYPTCSVSRERSAWGENSEGCFCESCFDVGIWGQVFCPFPAWLQTWYSLSLHTLAAFFLLSLAIDLSRLCQRKKNKWVLLRRSKAVLGIFFVLQAFPTLSYWSVLLILSLVSYAGWFLPAGGFLFLVSFWGYSLAKDKRKSKQE